MVASTEYLWIAHLIVVVAVAYLCGSIPTGYWAGRLLKGIDIREHGSRSTGATNVLRTLGKIPAIVVLLIDVLKGVAAIAFTRWFYSQSVIINAIPDGFNLETWLPWAITLAGLVAILGHSKSILLNFTGGKSVATSLGVLLAMSPLVGLTCLGVFGIVLAISRIVSLSSIAAAIATSGVMFALHQPLPYILLGIAGGLYVVIRHRANIDRLLTGTEPRLGQKQEQGS